MRGGTLQVLAEFAVIFVVSTRNSSSTTISDINVIADTGGHSCERFINTISSFEPFAIPVVQNDHGHNEPFQLGPVCCAPDPKDSDDDGRKEKYEFTSVATWYDDDESPIPNGTVTYNRKAAVYEICAQCSDSMTLSQGCTLVAVYEARQGLSIEGAGSFHSPIKAFPSSTSTTSVGTTTAKKKNDEKQEAMFDFQVMYEDDGATRPTGELTFDISESFRFHSTSFDWLIAHHARLAKLFGEGRVFLASEGGTDEGESLFGFMLTISEGSDGDYLSRDKFRIKIWEKKTSDTNHAVVYDNMMGSCDGEYDGSILMDGLVQVHVPVEYERKQQERGKDMSEDVGSRLRG